MSDAIGERWTLNQLEDERVRRSAILKAINVTDVRMAERCKHLGFMTETRETFVIVRECLRKDLERDVSIELGVAGAIHLTHATGAEQRDHFKWADQRAWCKSHEHVRSR